LWYTHAIEAVSIHTRSARLACLANPRHPLDAHAISNLDSRGVGPRAHLDDLAYALVPADLAGLCGEGQDLPCVEHDAHVGVADAGVGSGRVVSKLVEQNVNYGSSVCIEKSGGHGFTNRLIRTSPGPGSGTSSSSILVDIEPGLS